MQNYKYNNVNNIVPKNMYDKNEKYCKTALLYKVLDYN